MAPDGRRPNASAAAGRGTLLIDSLAGIYAAILVSATHYPKPQDLLGANPPSDKLLHLIAYGLLGVVTAAAASVRGGWNGSRLTLCVLVLAVFAALDEVTQPLFGRAVEFADWVADLAGLAIGVAAVVVWTRWRDTPREAPSPRADEQRF